METDGNHKSLWSLFLFCLEVPEFKRWKNVTREKCKKQEHERTFRLLEFTSCDEENKCHQTIATKKKEKKENERFCEMSFEQNF